MERTQKINALVTELKQLTGINIDVDTTSHENVDEVIEELHRLCNAYKEKYDKLHFLKNILHNTIPLHELNARASHFYIKPELIRASFLLETEYALDETVMIILKNLLPSRGESFLIPVSDNRMVILIPLSVKEYDESYLKTFAQNIINALNMEALINGWIACVPLIHHLSELHSAFEKLSVTLKIRRIFYSDQNVLLYNHLGVGRLISELPVSICDDFLSEVFTRGIPKIDPELISVTNCFFANNLNIAETARQLHMHRNTLIYRLEQIEQMTGLNLKDFEDAMMFKIALMIIDNKKYHKGA